MLGMCRRFGAVALGAALLVGGPLLAAACGPGAPGVGGAVGPPPCGGPTTTIPGPSTTVPEVPATTMPGTPGRPGPMVAIRADGAVVTLNAGSGEQIRELAPIPGPGSAAAPAIVTLSADGKTAWYDVRPCRPRPDAGSRIYQVPVDGSARPRAVATGTWPEADPTGGRLAYVAGNAVVVRDLATGAERRWTDAGARRLDWLGWAADDMLFWVRDRTQFVVLDMSVPDARPQAAPLAVAGPGEQLYATLAGGGIATMMAGKGIHDTDPDRLTVWPDLSVQRYDEPMVGGARDRSWDGSRQWGLRVDASGNIRWSVGGGQGLIAPGYLSADW